MANEYYAKHRCLPVIKPERVPSINLSTSVTVAGSSQSCFDPSDLSRDDAKYIAPEYVAETTPGWTDCVARLLAAAWSNLNSPPENPKDWGQVNHNLDNYHSEPIGSSRTVSIPGITNWCHQHDKMHWRYTDLSNVERNIFYIIPHSVVVEAISSLGWDIIQCRPTQIPGRMLSGIVVGENVCMS